MVIKSYSKINLELKVNFKSKNSLHEIEFFYCLINLFDKIKIKKIKGKKDKINFTGPFSKLIKSKNNSVYVLLKKLRKLKLISSFYSVKVIKNIPVFSGLGGGTSNAAYVLLYLLKREVDKNLLKKLEGTLGSDVMLFFKKQGYLKNLKTVIELKKKYKFYFVLIQPKIRCSTKEIYSKLKKFNKKKQFNKTALKSKKIFLDYLSKSRNDLQFIVEKKYPLLKKLLLDIKNEKGCHFSRMTGSGSVCYGLFEDKTVAKKALNNLRNKYPKFWLSLAKTV